MLIQSKHSHPLTAKLNARKTALAVLFSPSILLDACAIYTSLKLTRNPVKMQYLDPEFAKVPSFDQTHFLKKILCLFINIILIQDIHQYLDWFIFILEINVQKISQFQKKKFALILPRSAKGTSNW